MKGIVLPAIIESIATRVDNSLKVGLGLQEISPSTAAELLALRGKVIVAYLSPKDVITKTEAAQIDAIDADLPGKTKSERLRNVLFVLWKSQPEGHAVFDNYYAWKMEAIINEYKNKLPPQY